MSLQKQQALKAIEQQTEEKSRREAELEKDVERLRSELQFKEHDLTERHGMRMCTLRFKPGACQFLVAEQGFSPSYLLAWHWYCCLIAAALHTMVSSYVTTAATYP